MIFTINNRDIANYNENEEHVFPKYTSQLINWANQNAQGTRPKVVGQMSELFAKYRSVHENKDITVKTWKNWYTKNYPQAIDEASDKIYEQIKNLAKAILLIDENMVRKWVEDLLIDKTYNGLYVQKAIFAYLAQINKSSYRLANPEEEAKGIDGYIGNTPYSVKPESYKIMNRLSESIKVTMIYYQKTKTGLKIEVQE